MTTEKAVFEKLFKDSKTELATQKVELGLVDDFEKLFNKGLDVGQSSFGKLVGDLRKGEVAANKVIDIMSSAVKSGDKIKSASKELGIDVPQIILNKIDSAKAEIKEANTIIAKIKQMYSIF